MPGRPPLPATAVALMRRIAADNPLCVTERILGALLNVVIRVAKRSMQTSPGGHHAQRPQGPVWTAFPRNHAHEA